MSAEPLTRHVRETGAGRSSKARAMTSPPPSLRIVTPPETKTHCPYCAFQCGMLVKELDSGALSVRADEEFPVNRGQMCIKGFTSGDLIRHSERVKTPLLRRPSGEL